MIRYVNLVVQVVGMGKIPLIPKDSETLRAWYSKVVFPRSHSRGSTNADVSKELPSYRTSPAPSLCPRLPDSQTTRASHSNRYIILSFVSDTVADFVNTSVDEVKPIKTMIKALPLIRDNVQQLGRPKT